MNFSHSLDVPLSERLAEIIRQAIFTGQLPSGSKIPQDELAEEFGVSRMPIREALVILNYEGLVRVEPRRGAWVAPLTMESVDEAYTMRRWAEAKAVELSLPRLTDQDLELARQQLHLLEDAEETRNAERFVRTNRDFHQILRERCPWPKLLGLVDTLWNGFPPLTPTFVADQMTHDRNEHRQLFEAALRRQAKEAAELMAKHIDRSWSSARAHFLSLGWPETREEGAARNAST